MGRVLAEILTQTQHRTVLRALPVVEKMIRHGVLYHHPCDTVVCYLITRVMS